MRWYSHTKRMDESKLVKKVYENEFIGERRVGRPRKRWKDCVKTILSDKGTTVKQTEEIVYDRSIWKHFVRGRASSILPRL